MIMNEISVILNIYKRPENVLKQLNKILELGILPENIYVWYNDNLDFDLKNDKIKIYKSSWNTKFWGRFMISLLINTKYVALFDDDILPSNKWFDNCINSINKQEGLYGGSGVRLIKDFYNPNSKVGWNGLHSDKIEEVDLVGHAWFFKQEWSKYLWYEKPYSWDNGEDIMFSYLLQKHGNIKTFVPPHPENNKELWCTDYKFAFESGNDDNASFKKTNHYNLRNEIVKHCINNGWNTIKSRKNL